MQADTVKTAIKKLTDTSKKHMHHFQCQQSEYKYKNYSMIGLSNEIIGISHLFMHKPWQ